MSIKPYFTKHGMFNCFSNDEEFVKYLSRGEVYEERIITNIIIPILNNIKEDLIILDIGGHIGSHSILYGKQVNNCKIYTYEAQQRMFDILEMNVIVNGIENCNIFKNAMGHKIMETTMSSHLYDGYDCEIEYDTNEPMNYGGIGLGEAGEKVNMITIDSLNLERCDYIKMDVEGAEILVLMGGRNTIEKFRPLVWFEQTDKIVSDEMKRSLGIDYELLDTKDYLQNMGYRFIQLNEANILAYYADISIEITLDDKEQTIYSESGEDGILFELLRIYGTTNKYYLEFGAEDGTQCNTRALRMHHGFDGVLFDGGYENSDINLFKYIITKENVIEIFKTHGVPKMMDVLSVDIDSYDFYVLDEILKNYTPRIFVCEYNATHLPNEDKVVLKDSVNYNGNYFGASIRAYYNLGKKYNYSIVYANKKGVNLFFVHNDVMKNSIYSIKYTNNVEKIYNTPKYGRGPNGGHEQDVYNQQYVTSKSLLEIN
jgi:FkbM family methyltransferase